MRKLILFAFIVTLFLWGCTSSDGTGNFQIYLTDQPVDDAEEILITISEINVQKEGEGFLTVSTGTQTYDLLALRDKEEKIVDVTLKEGKYTQIRLVVTAGRILIAGESEPHIMTVRSSEVKIPLVFHIMEDGDIEIVLDFEAEHSIHAVTAGQSNQYILTPVIKVESISY